MIITLKKSEGSLKISKLAS
jgi:hypothetical protein